ncbi:MAG: chain length determinant protein tyrosine kinase EpsG [Gammaproteobacteria bacterium]
MNQPLFTNRNSPTQLVSSPVDRTLGKILIDSGKLTPEGVERIVEYQKERGLRFGEAALKLRLVTKRDLQYALANQFGYDYLQEGEGDVSKDLVAAYEPFSQQAEALRSVRGQLILRKLGSHHKTLVILSPDQGEGRSYLASNLAVVFSQLGENTLLIDADLRTPRQHTIFNLENRVGLSSILGGRAGFETIQHVPSFDNLSVLCAGATPPNPSELLCRTEFSRLLQALADRYGVVIIDTPAGDANADAQSITAQAGTARAIALMVIRKDHTRLKKAKSFMDDLKGTNVEIVGTVLNQF